MRSRKAEDLLVAWLEACIVDDYHLVKDSLSSTLVSPEFLDHRYDQSILSCLMKSETIQQIADESNFPNAWNNDGVYASFWATRHHWGTPFPVTGLWRRSQFYFERQWFRFKNIDMVRDREAHTPAS